LSTMVEIAKSLRVSVQTVSAVVNGKSGISGATQARVREALVRFDYQPNAQARALRGHPPKTIGVVIPSITNPYFPEFVKGVDDAARSQGYSIFLCNTEAKREHLLEYFRLTRTNRAAGLVCSFGPGRDWLDDPEVRSWIRKFVKSGAPVVVNGWLESDLPVRLVHVDCDAAVSDAARHLIDLGHQRIAMITPRFRETPFRDRATAYRRAFAGLGRPIDETLVATGGFGIEDGAEATRELFRRGRPTAIVAANDLSAFGAISALAEMGLRAPEDVSILGFDDIPFARVFQPALSTIRQPLYELGREALRLAIAGRQDDSSPASASFEATFIARKSTGPAQ
jgi:DNA-binding LacI/PurR family transcriptional regulator